MTDVSLSLFSAAMVMGGLAIVSLAALRGWSQWIALRRAELAGFAPQQDDQRSGAGTGTASRIEIADLRERVRKLEAIAAGVDL